MTAQLDEPLFTWSYSRIGVTVPV